MSTVGYAFLENKVKDLDERIVALGGVSLADMMSSDPSDTTLRKGFDLATMGSIKDDPEFARLVAEILKQNKDLLAVQQNNIQNNTQTIFPDSPSANADMSIPYHITGRYD
jgi:hypothetical protein